MTTLARDVAHGIAGSTDWIQTYTRRRVSMTGLDAGDIDVRDIAHALSNQCRFAGHTSRFYDDGRDRQEVRLSSHSGDSSPITTSARMINRGRHRGAFPTGDRASTWGESAANQSPTCPNSDMTIPGGHGVIFPNSNHDSKLQK